MKKISRILSAVLSIIIFSTSTCLAAPTKFKDVSSSAWYAKDVLQLSSLGIVGGYTNGNYGPNDNISVDEFIKMVISALGYKVDKNGDYWAYNYIQKARELNIVRDHDFDKFTRPIIRAEMARVISRIMVKETDNIPVDSLSKEVKDSGSFPVSFRSQILQTYYLGIIKGCPGNVFLWENKATRAEAASIIMRLINSLKSNSKVN